MTANVLIEQRGELCIVTLNRPEKLNAIDELLINALDSALTEVTSLNEVRAVILHGSGRAFCAGNDLEATEVAAAAGLSEAHVRASTDVLQNITRTMTSSACIFIGAIHGWAVGAGFEWAINCDFTVWGEKTRAFFPEIGLGVFPTGGVLTLLPRMVGLQRAREMLFLGQKYSANQLHDYGVASRVVPDLQVLAEAEALASHLLTMPAHTVAALKQALGQTPYMGIADTLDRESAELVRAMMSLDSNELR